MNFKKFLFSLAILLAIGGGTSNALAQSSGNLSGTALTSAARTVAQVNSADLTNTEWQGVHVIMNVSAYTSGNYTPKIQAKDPVSGAYYDLLVGPAISSTGTTVLKVYPGIPGTANASASDILPKTWRVQVNGASTPSMTFSVGFQLVE